MTTAVSGESPTGLRRGEVGALDALVGGGAGFPYASVGVESGISGRAIKRFIVASCQRSIARDPRWQHG
jgi:hypothetical protein